MQAPVRGVGPEAAAALRRHERRATGQGGILFREGDPGDRLYVIEEGKIKLGPPRPMVATPCWR